MDKQIKQCWIDALRSGKYQQTREVLKNDSGYCCLGVLCEVVGLVPEKRVINPHRNGPDGEWGFVLPGRCWASGEIREEFATSELTDAFAKQLEIENYAIDLMAMNDGDGFGDQGVPQQTFAQIADYIEREIP